MSTVFDFLTMGIFAGLVVLFLQRSASEEPPKDHLWQYLVAAAGCAVANFVGNEGYAIPAAILIFGVLVYIAYILRPFPNFPPR